MQVGHSDYACEEQMCTYLYEMSSKGSASLILVFNRESAQC